MALARKKTDPTPLTAVITDPVKAAAALTVEQPRERETVGAYVRRIRQERGLTMAALAKKADMTMRQTDRTEMNPHTIDTAEWMRIAKALDLPADTFQNWWSRFYTDDTAPSDTPASAAAPASDNPASDTPAGEAALPWAPTEWREITRDERARIQGAAPPSTSTTPIGRLDARTLITTPNDEQVAAAFWWMNEDNTAADMHMLAAAHGLIIQCLDISDDPDAPEELTDLYASGENVLADWHPRPPTADHFLVSKFDTDEGPAAWFARPIQAEERDRISNAITEALKQGNRHGR